MLHNNKLDNLYGYAIVLLLIVLVIGYMITTQDTTPANEAVLSGVMEGLK